MAEKPVYSSKLLNDEIEKSKGVYYPVKAGFLRCLLIKHAYCSKLHPNLEDEFCDPAIGPNYGIIKRYQLDFKKPKPLPSKSYEGETGDAQEPLIVQKARPDGYMILNGHHRWAAALLLGVRRLKIRIVNLTQESDIHEMLEKSRSDTRVALDLDEVVFCSGDSAFVEKPLRFPLNRIYKERLRLGVPALFHFINSRNYDIWVYTSKYYSMEYIYYFFKRWGVHLNGIVTGTGRKGDTTATMRELNRLLDTKYSSTIYIDNGLLMRTFSGSKEREECQLSGSPETWSKEVIDAIERWRR